MPSPRVSVFSPSKNRRTIALRLIVYIAIFSVVFALGLTAWQLFIDYRSQVHQIDAQIQQSYDLYHKSIAKAAWDLDKVSCGLLINGLLKLNRIEYLSVKTELGHLLAEAGKRPKGETISNEFQLTFHTHGRAEPVGTLEVVAGLEEAYRILQRKAFAILSAEAVRIILIVAFTLYFFYRLVTRHLGKMALYAQQLDMERLDKPLTLDRRGRTNNNVDELDSIVYAINEMRVGLLHDISKLKSTEEELRVANERHFAVLQANPDPVVVYDNHGRTVFLNPAFTRVFGWSSEEVLAKRIDFVPVEEQERTEAGIKELFVTGEPVSLATKRLTKDGRILDVMINAAPVRDAKNKTTGMVVDLRDVTEQRRLEEQLRQSQKMEAVGTLAGGIAHDFNNILAAVMGFSELGLDAAAAGRATPNEHQQVLKAAGRAKRLVQQILAFSRKAESKLKPVNINKEISRAIPLIERTIPKMISVELHLGQDMQLINGEPNQIEQVFLNLAGNAADAMPDGGKLVIETESVTLDQEYANTHLGASAGDYILISVSDTGEGMDKDILEHIFEPFYTTKEVGKGTGLGLSSVFGIVKSHGGHIICYSEPGTGTTFRIYLPTLKSIAEPDEADNAKIDIIPGGTETIMLVDDEDAIREIGSLNLNSKGYQVLTANSGEEALAIYRDKGVAVDLVILDISMPGMGGHKALKEFLSINPEAKVVIASGYSRYGQVKDTLESGAAGYIAKPFQMAKLLITVREVLDG